MAQSPTETTKTESEIRVSITQGAAMRQDVFSLTEGEVVLSWPTPLSEESISDLEVWLELIKRKISRSQRAVGWVPYPETSDRR